MKKLLWILLVILIALGGYWGWKTEWKFIGTNLFMSQEMSSGAVNSGEVVTDTAMSWETNTGEIISNIETTNENCETVREDWNTKNKLKRERYNAYYPRAINFSEWDKTNTDLIRGYYYFIWKKEFNKAVCFVVDEENDVNKLKQRYDTLPASEYTTIRAYKVERIWPSVYQFYVILNYDASSWGNTAREIYDVKKEIIDWKIKSVSSEQISWNSSNQYFTYYSDDFLKVKTSSFNVSDIMTFEHLKDPNCHETKVTNEQIKNYKKIISQTGREFNFYFVSARDYREPDFEQEGGTRKWLILRVVPNIIWYSSKEVFLKDFEPCGVWGVVPLWISEKNLFFIDSCGGWAGQPEYCGLIQDILFSLIQYK